jgi:hypothetical protein
MSTADWTQYVDSSAVPRLSKAQATATLDAYPPPMEPLVGMWSALSRQPLRGISSDGNVTPGLFDPAPNGAPVRAAAEAATRWLDALPAQTRAKVSLPLDSDLWRHWHNTPLLLRDQVELLQLDPPLRELALDVARASLSPEGYRRTREVMANSPTMGWICCAITTRAADTHVRRMLMMGAYTAMTAAAPLTGTIEE